MKTQQKKEPVRRVFSEAFKLQKVKEFEQKLITVCELSKEYEVSRAAIYKWIYKYSTYLEKGLVMVVQMESEEEKTKKLKEQIAELQRVIGQKQLEIDFLNKMIDIGKEEFGIDLKKKSSTGPSTGSSSIEQKESK